MVEQLKLRILTGFYKPGERLPSVRELAVECRVNPNTLQRAFGELEGLSLVINNRTLGRSITEDAKLIETLRREVARGYLRDFLNGMGSLGFTDAEIILILKEKERILSNG